MKNIKPSTLQYLTRTVQDLYALAALFEKDSTYAKMTGDHYDSLCNIRRADRIVELAERLELMGKTEAEKEQK